VGIAAQGRVERGESVVADPVDVGTAREEAPRGRSLTAVQSVSTCRAVRSSPHFGSTNLAVASSPYSASSRSIAPTSPARIASASPTARGSSAGIFIGRRLF
jgi:hypothetical protein